MAKPNYAIAKRQRDLAKKKKKEEKRKRKLEAKRLAEEEANPSPPEFSQETAEPSQD